MENVELTVLMPCLNEIETIETCIKKAQHFFYKNSINGEVLIADNGSTDGSQQVALSLGANVVHVSEKGYGSALLGGIKAAKGKYIIMGDADDSYDFSSLEYFIEKLRDGCDLVMGNRFKGGVKPGAMPFLHKYLGNPVLSFLGRLFFKSDIGDFHCGLRGFTKEAALLMDLRCKGMEFASEMVVKATLLNFKIAEVPTVLSPDGRSRPPHLRTWRDGWRHLRFLLMYAPDWLFLYPGILLMLFGFIFSVFLINNPIQIGQIVLDVHTLLYTSLSVVIGFQSITFFLFTKIYAVNNGLIPSNTSLNDKLKFFNLEKGLVLGLVVLLAGIILTIKAFLFWDAKGFGPLNTSYMLRWVIPASVLIILGFQMVLYSFFFSILKLKD